MEQDMAESMRLAEQRPGFKYACTVCKKRFHDYANMCRHRRLAHQRHLLISKRPVKCEVEEQSPANPLSTENAELDPHSYFFANVARNIAENLKYFVEGGQDNLKNPDMHIKWKKEDDGVVNTDSPSDPADPSPKLAVLQGENYSHYNFPTGFEPKTNYHKMVQMATNEKLARPRNCSEPVQSSSNVCVLSVPSFHPNKDKSKNVDLKIKKETCEVSEEKAMDSTSNPGKKEEALSCIPKTKCVKKSPKLETNTSRPTSPISVPNVRICSICHSIFHKADMFQAHMKTRHKVDVESETPDSCVTSPVTPDSPSKASLPFSSYQTVAAMDLSNIAEPQLYDLNGALDLTSPVKKSPVSMEEASER